MSFLATVDRPSRGSDHAQVRPSARPRASVLVVDDDPALRRAFGRLLQRPFAVTACDVGEALAKLGVGERFDAILCDVMMPCMNGLEFYRRIRELDEALAARIVFVTAGAPLELVHQLAKLPNAMLGKPVSREELVTALMRVLTR